MNPRGKAMRRLSPLIAAAAALMLILTSSVFDSHAATETVTISRGKQYLYGTGEDDHVRHRWVTHINGEPLDAGNAPEGRRSSVYCVQPRVEGPGTGDFPVTIIDDDDVFAYEM